MCIRDRVVESVGKSNETSVYIKDGYSQLEAVYVGKAIEKLDNVLSAKGCEKAAEFVSFCDAFEIPVLTLTNVKVRVNSGL